MAERKNPIRCVECGSETRNRKARGWQRRGPVSTPRWYCPEHNPEERSSGQKKVAQFIALTAGLAARIR